MRADAPQLAIGLLVTNNDKARTLSSHCIIWTALAFKNSQIGSP